MNIAGEDNFWGLLRFLETEPRKPDLIALQELSFLRANVGRAAAKANFLGYRLLFDLSLPDRQGRFRGTGWLVKNSLPTQTTESFGDRSGQATTLVLANLVLVSFWRSPGDKDSSALVNFVEAVQFSAKQRGQGFVLVGDFNWAPAENVWAENPDLRILAWCDEDGCFGPTRLEGHRCIDYCLLGNAAKGEALGAWSAKFSDHKAMYFTFQHIVPRLNYSVVAHTASFAHLLNLPNISELLTQIWDQQVLDIPVDVAGNSDAEWLWFSGLLEHMLSTAVAVTGTACHTGLRCKGSAPIVLAASDERLAGCRRGTYEERSLRKLLGRLHEFQLQQRCGKSCPRLRAKINNSWPCSLPWQGVTIAAQQVEKRLAELLRHEKARALAKWRADLQSGGKRATRWLKGETQLPPPVILDPAGQPTQCLDDGLHQIRDFWQQIWQRDARTARLAELQAMVATGSVRTSLPCNHCDWVPTAEALRARAQQMAGTAAGLDGWDAKELAILPLGVFALFRTLALEWGNRHVWPTVWNDVRQVHLRKDTSDPLRPTYPADLRPISIFSTWYRLLTGSFMAQDSVRNWVQQVVPSQAHCGVCERWVATALAEIVPQLDEGAPALALDFAKCFDHVDPQLVLAHLRLHSWPEALVSLLEQVWLGQRRFLQLGKCTLADAIVVSSSLPQGDPVSPLGLLLVLGDAITEISAQATFLDDRVLVADTVSRLLQGQRAWTKWSARLGLKENEHKAVALAQTQHQRMAFLRAGFRPERICDQIRVVGVDIFAPGAASVGHSQQTRSQDSLTAAARLARAPVAPQKGNALPYSDYAQTWLGVVGQCCATMAGQEGL